MRYRAAMDLEPCSAKEFDLAVIRYASMPGWRSRIVQGQRCEGYVDGHLVLLLRRRGEYAEHFRARVEAEPYVPVEGFRYK